MYVFGLRSRNPDFTKDVTNANIMVPQETWHREEDPGANYREDVAPSTKLAGIKLGRNLARMFLWYKSERTNSIGRMEIKTLP